MKNLLILLLIFNSSIVYGFERGSGFDEAELKMKKNPIIFEESEDNPSTPLTNSISVYAKDKNGTTTLYTKDSSGTVTEVSSISGVTPIVNGGTGESSAQDALNALGDAVGGTNEDVLTLDTDTGNIMLKPASGGFWTEASTLDYLTTVSNKLAIGKNSLIGTEKVLIEGSADIIQTIIRGNATQTANILEVRKSDDSVLLGVTNTAGITVGGASALITPNSGNVGITGTDDTKIMEISLGGATGGKTMTLVSSHTDNRTLTLPDTTDTLVGRKARVVTTMDDATAVIDVAVTDVYELSAVANNTTFSTTGTPSDGQKLLIRFKDAGVAKDLTWDGIFVAIGVTAPVITVAGKWHYVFATYNTGAGKFHILATGVQA